MTREERELAITYLEEMKETYIEGVGYERHPLPEYYAIVNAIKALEQELVLDKLRAEVEQITSRYSISRERGGMGQVEWSDNLIKESEVLEIIDKYKAESEPHESEGV